MNNFHIIAVTEQATEVIRLEGSPMQAMAKAHQVARFEWGLSERDWYDNGTIDELGNVTWEVEGVTITLVAPNATRTL